MKRLIEFLFFRWKVTVHSRGTEKWTTYLYGSDLLSHQYQRDYIEYKYTNKFDGSEKIKRKYIN